MPPASTTRILIGVACVVALVLTVFLWRGTAASSVDGSSIAPAPVAERPVVLAPAAAVEGGRSAEAQGSPPESDPLETGEGSARADEQPTRAIGRCVDPGGAPLGEVAIECSYTGASALSAADGRFELELHLPGTRLELELSLRVARSGHATQLVNRVGSRNAVNDLGTLVLLPGASIRGRVLDVAGRALAGADVICSDREPFAHHSRQHGTSVRLSQARTDPEGAFRLEGVPAWAVRVWAHAQGYLWTYSEPLVVPAGEERADVEIVLETLEREDTIELVVLGPDGEPLAGADVRFQYKGASHGGSGSGQADEQGRYVHPLVMRVAHHFQAHDPEGRFAPASVRDVAPGARDLVLQLDEPRWLEVRVRDSEGNPVEDFHASALERVGEFTLYIPAEGEPPFSGGIARLMCPAGSFSIKMGGNAHVEQTLGPFDPLTVVSPLDVTLERLPSAQGRVTAAGRPIAGAKVSLHFARDPGTNVLNGFPVRSACFPQATTVSGTDGTFEIGLERASPYYLRAEAEGWPGADIGPLDPSVEPSPRGLEIVLARAGSIEGRVLLPPGEDPAGVLVGYSRGDGCGRTAFADGEGRFRLEDLSPGAWLLERRHGEIQPGFASSWILEREGSTGGLPSSCEVRAGETTRFDLDLRFEPRARLRGRVLVGGAPAIGWRATLTPRGRAGEPLRASLDAEGRFRLPAGPPGEFALQVSGSGAGRFEISDVLTLPEGEIDWELELPLGRVVATMPTAHGLGARYSWKGEGNLSVRVAGLEPAPDGRISFDAPAGTGSLESNSTKPLTVVVPAGGTVEAGS